MANLSEGRIGFEIQTLGLMFQKEISRDLGFGSKNPRISFSLRFHGIHRLSIMLLYLHSLLGGTCQ